MSMHVSKAKEVIQESQGVDTEDKTYVAVGKEVRENKLILSWALQNSGGKRVCIVHVHQPAQKIPTPIGYFPADKLGDDEVNAYREKERREISKILDEYLRVAQKVGVRIEKLYIEAHSIDRGIIQLIYQHRIGKLVMGAAADKRL